MRLSLAREVGYHHGNRLGYYGYGFKLQPKQVYSRDPRHFRDLKLCEVGGWLRNQELSFPAVRDALRRRFYAWRYKYSMPVNWHFYTWPNMNMGPIVRDTPGAAYFLLTGSALAQYFMFHFILGQSLMYYVGETHHHAMRKYHW
jgi:hypothetical protein